MTEFVTPSPKVDGPPPIDATDWNQDIVYNTIALHERLPNYYPYVQIANTVTETNLFLQSLTAGVLSTKGFLIAEFGALMKNNSGGSITPTVRAYLGATALSAIGPSIATGANGTLLTFRFRIQNTAANAQIILSEVMYMTSPVPEGSTQSLSTSTRWDLDTVDTSVALDFKVTCALSAAHASATFDLVSAKVVGPISLT